MSINIHPIPNSPVKRISVSQQQMKVEFFTLGAMWHEWLILDNGEFHSLLMHPQSLEDSYNSSMHYGRFIGRTAGRLFSPIEIDHKVINLPPKGLLHGGKNGLSWKNFSIDSTSTVAGHDQIVLSASITEQEDGLPGNVSATITIDIDNNHVRFTFDACTTTPTLVNFTYHPYFNLGNSSTIDNHHLCIPSQGYVAMDEDFHVKSIEALNDTMNFNKLRPLNTSKDYKWIGYDNYWLRDNQRSPIVVMDPDTRRKLYVQSDLPYCVMYTHNVTTKLPMDRQLGYHGGVAIEPQLQPYGLAKNHEYAALLKPSESYHHYIDYSYELSK